MHLSLLNRVITSVLMSAFLVQIKAEARERREFYNGVRGLAMGGAYVATVNDETALALNPAALGKLRDFYGTILDPEFELGNKSYDVYRAQAITQLTKVDSVVPALVLAPDTFYHTKYQFFPSFVARNFGIGLLYNTTMSGIATSSTAVDTFYRSDMSLLLGYNLRLFDGRLKLGLTGKFISRIELDEETLNPNQTLTDDALAVGGLLKEGAGVGVDAGLILTAPWSWLPTLAVVAKDIGSTSYDKTFGQRLASAINRPNATVQDADVALSISPIHQNRMRSVWTVEYRGLLTGKDEPDKAKLLHFGAEFNLYDTLFLRAGYHQRYWTAGAELAGERFQFQFASYGEEVGTQAVPREDRRFVLKAVLRF